jgi:hypothetical protein
MEDKEEPEPQSKPETESSADFLAKLGDMLRKKEDIDTGLASVLAEHLLTTTPAADAVAKAKAVILKLASDRANPPQKEADHG